MENQEKKYTKEDVYEALGINEKLIANEETNSILSKMIDCVTGVNIDEIRTEEDFNKAMEIYKNEIKVSENGNRFAGIIEREDSEIAYQTAELGRNALKRDEVRVTTTTIDDIIPKNRRRIQKKMTEFEMKEGEDKILKFSTQVKDIEQPGEFKEEITLQDLEEIYYNEKDWDETMNAYKAEDLINMSVYAEDTGLRRDSAKSYRETLKAEYEEYQNNKTNPEVVKDKNQLKINILKELGVNEKILEKPELLAELDRIVEYASKGYGLDTKEGVEKTLEQLRETTEITETSISGVQSNYFYLDYANNSIRLTEGVKISLNEGMYEVEKTKEGRAFKDENGNIQVRQQTNKTTYRENYADKAELEEVRKESRGINITENIGEKIPTNLNGGTNMQSAYFIENIPERYEQLQTQIADIPYETTWEDTRNPEEQERADTRKTESREKREEEARKKAEEAAQEPER